MTTDGTPSPVYYILQLLLASLIAYAGLFIIFR